METSYLINLSQRISYESPTNPRRNSPSDEKILWAVVAASPGTTRVDGIYRILKGAIIAITMINTPVILAVVWIEVVCTLADFVPSPSSWGVVKKHLWGRRPPVARRAFKAIVDRLALAWESTQLTTDIALDGWSDIRFWAQTSCGLQIRCWDFGSLPPLDNSWCSSYYRNL